MMQTAKVRHQNGSNAPPFVLLHKDKRVKGAGKTRSSHRR
jgi:hypothetical protein